MAILGANGQIGTVLCREWLRSSVIRPVAIVRNRLAEAVLRVRLGGDLEIRRGSVAETKDTLRLLEGCESVVNCSYASSGGFRGSRLANEASISAVLGTQSVRRLVQLSSVAVYGASQDGSSTFERPRPTNSYGREKLAHEKFSISAAKTDSGRLTIVRVGHVYGAEQVMSRFILESISDRRFRLPDLEGEGSNCVSLRAMVSGLQRAVIEEASSGIFNLVDNPNRGWRDIFAWHADSVGLPIPDRLTREQTRAAASAALVPAGDDVSDVVRATINAVRPAGLGRLAAAPPVRSRVDGLFASGPAFLESAMRKIHVTGSVSAQLSCIEPAFASLPYWIFLNAAPGPNIAGDEHSSDEGASQFLHAWWRRVSAPRWHD
ncbi:MAG: NAD-dependent epimerase/dehydratase family protein [Elusimicrobia bacterium]|nr:NAD-dependent epimerase/dehydratase family protein [Elusimicrobiota bacterium]